MVHIHDLICVGGAWQCFSYRAGLFSRETQWTVSCNSWQFVYSDHGWVCIVYQPGQFVAFRTLHRICYISCSFLISSNAPHLSRSLIRGTLSASPQRAMLVDSWGIFVLSMSHQLLFSFLKAPEIILSITPFCFLGPLFALFDWY